MTPSAPAFLASLLNIIACRKLTPATPHDNRHLPIGLFDQNVRNTQPLLVGKDAEFARDDGCDQTVSSRPKTKLNLPA